MLPGINSKALKGLDVNEKDIVKIQAIIQSMTMEERKTHQLSIAAGGKNCSG